MKAINKLPTQLTIAIPVYNGERYISTAIESILSQSFTDLTLLICDNASTDYTVKICKDYAEKDARIRIYCNDQNIGAAANFNNAFELNRSPFFKWHACDDFLAPNFIEKSMDALYEDPEIVLATSSAVLVDEQGKYIRDYENPLRANNHASRIKRFVDLTKQDHLSYYCLEVFGVFRASTLAMTRKIGAYMPSDRILLSEVALHGRIYIDPDRLFFSRQHHGQSVSIPLRRRDGWFDPKYASVYALFPHFRIWLQYWIVLIRGPGNFISKLILACYLVIYPFGESRLAKKLLGDIWEYSKLKLRMIDSCGNRNESSPLWPIVRFLRRGGGSS